MEPAQARWRTDYLGPDSIAGESRAPCPRCTRHGSIGMIVGILETSVAGGSSCRGRGAKRRRQPSRTGLGTRSSRG